MAPKNGMFIKILRFVAKKISRFARNDRIEPSLV